MAKKESKSKQHTRDLVAGMRSSNSQSRTPISSLYPKKVQVKSSTTSQAHRTKGTKQANVKNPNTMPQKFLLSVTNPGNRPNAPTQPKAPEAVDRPGRLPELNTDNYRGWDPERRDFSRDEYGERSRNLRGEQERDLETATNRYNTYERAQASHVEQTAAWNRAMATYRNTTLPNWEGQSAQYTSRTAKNVKTTSKYNKDIKNFLSSLGGKNKGEVSHKVASRMRGSRNTNTRSGGARS